MLTLLFIRCTECTNCDYNGNITTLHNVAKLGFLWGLMDKD